MEEAQRQIFVRGSQVFPYPVAVACGRVYRSGKSLETVDACIKAAEVLIRYCSVLGLASISARDEKSVDVPGSFRVFEGNLSFGKFLSICEGTVSVDTKHPLREFFLAAFGNSSKYKNSALPNYLKILKLRNELGHDISGLTEASATTILRDQHLDHLLAGILKSLEPLLTLPLFLLEDQQIENNVITARRLVCMGDFEPVPDEITIKQGMKNRGKLYLGVPNGALSLYPLMLWDIAAQRQCYSIYLVHAVGDEKIKYKSVEREAIELNGETVEIVKALRNGTSETFEGGEMYFGFDFRQDWCQDLARREAVLKMSPSSVSWTELDKETLEWFACRVGSSKDDVVETVRDILLDGRNTLPKKDSDQVSLLFGSESLVRKTLGRNTLDCRAKKNMESTERWDERLETNGNILIALRNAIDFFSRHIGIEGLGLDGMKATSGTADYVATREALVNMFIHQDYADKSAAAQIEITEDQTKFFNQGRSLVSQRSLTEGGKSQSRNPIVARALRLLGFAELAGSGLREVHRVWRGERRRPPIVESEKDANSFSLTLDWRQLPDDFDAFWRQKIGVKISDRQASILSLLNDDQGFTSPEISSAQGGHADAIADDLSDLRRQGLIDDENGRFKLEKHLRKAAEEWKPIG